MNYAIPNNLLIYNYLLILLLVTYYFFCTILKHNSYENGQF